MRKPSRPGTCTSLCVFAVAYIMLRRQGVFADWPVERWLDFLTAVALGLWYL